MVAAGATDDAKAGVEKSRLARCDPEAANCRCKCTEARSRKAVWVSGEKVGAPNNPACASKKERHTENKQERKRRRKNTR